jgi:4-cresol dehydrogenase (hydroxylating)
MAIWCVRAWARWRATLPAPVPLQLWADVRPRLHAIDLGAATKACVWLQPAPETSLEIVWDIPNEEDIAWVVDTIARSQDLGPDRPERVRAFVAGQDGAEGPAQGLLGQAGAIPEWRVQELLKQYKLGYWQVALRLYGEESVVKAKAEVVKAAMKRHLDAALQSTGGGRAILSASTRRPWACPRRCRCRCRTGSARGAHGLLAGGAGDGAHVMDQLKRSRKIIADHDVDFYASFTIGGRFANNINMLMYDRDQPEMVANMLEPVQRADLGDGQGRLRRIPHPSGLDGPGGGHLRVQQRGCCAG